MDLTSELVMHKGPRVVNNILIIHSKVIQGCDGV